MIATIATIVILAVSPVNYVTDRLAPIYQGIQRIFHHGSSDSSINKTNSKGKTRTNTPTEPTPAPTSTAPSTIDTASNNPAYLVHKSIPATVFWAGEAAGEDNGFITNVESAWSNDWVKSFGGIDDPLSRLGFLPKGFTPKENVFYFALPFSDYGNNGPKADLSMVPWLTGKLKNGQSALKNRWIAVEHNGKTAYAQWEDVGPYHEDDSAYVFGTAGPKYKKAGLDLSPATAKYLGMGDTGKVNWRFVDEAQVPEGEWKKVVTTSAPAW